MGLPRHLAPLGLAAAVVLLIAFFAIVLVGRGERAHSALPGATADNFRLPDLNSRLVSLNDLRGRVVVMYLAGQNSAPVYDPALLEMARNFQDESRVAMLAVYPDTGTLTAGLTQTLRQQAEQAPSPLATLIDGNLDVLRKYRGGRAPTYFVIDQDGVIRFRGGVDEGGMEQPQMLDDCRTTIETLLTHAPTDTPFPEPAS
jgi:peroxiredoxin